MAFSGGNHASAHSDDAATTAAIDTTGMDLLVAVTADISSIGNTNRLSDSKGNTWHELTTQTGGSGVGAIYYAWNPTVGTGHTFTFGTTGAFAGVSVAAFSGSQTSSDPFDVQNGASSGSASSLATGSVTPSVDNELLIFGATGNWAGTLSVDVGTLLESQPVSNDFATSLAYQIQTTATARNPSFSWTGGAAASEALIATFKAASGAAAVIWGFDEEVHRAIRRRTQSLAAQVEPIWPGTVTASPAQFGWDNPEKFAIRRHFQPLQPDEPAEQWPLTATPVPGQFGWVNPEQFAKRQIVRGVSRQDADVTVTAPGTPTPTQQGFAWEPQFAIRRRFRTFQSPDDEFRFTATVTPTQFGWNVEPQFAKRPKARFNIYPGDEQWPFTAVKTPLPLGFSSDPQFPIRGRARTLVRDDHEFVAFIDSSTGQIISIRYIGPVWKRRRSLPAEQ